MADRKKPVLRLTIFFISVVLVSGSILAYLSINNISNLKELTEKKILEEQKKLALELGARLDHEIVGAMEKFSDHWKPAFDQQTIPMNVLDSLDMVEEIFLVDGHGNFIVPWFLDAYMNHPGMTSTSSFRSAFGKAERSEFIEKNLGEANSYYLSSLKTSSDKFDSVKCLNALARVAVKMEDGPQALLYYSYIISKYQDLCDQNGFPYVYYAIPQLIRIANSSNRMEIIQVIADCLSGMRYGEIPLNYSTYQILAQLTDWMEKKSGSEEIATGYKESIEIVSKRLLFLDRYRDLILLYANNEGRNDIPKRYGGYQVLQNSSGHGGQSVFITREDDMVSGFSIRIEQLWEAIGDDQADYLTEFEYELELLKPDYARKLVDDPLSTSMEVSTYFPDYMVLIKLKNKDLLDEFIRRRSWIYGIALALLLGGMILGILLILRDISREEHLARLRADFISNVTHELKTPLTSIQLFTESMILKRIKSEDNKLEYLNIILKEAESLKRMINNILDFSRKEKGIREYHFEVINLSSLVNSAINDLEYWLVEKKFLLVKELEDNIIALADPSALKQAVINLLNNAIKFSVDRKEIAVRLQKDHEHILIQVEDRGIGIPDDAKDLIFNPFYRVGQKYAEDISGTGLGLSVVKEIVDAHHGEIKVESRMHEGSNFIIRIPANQKIKA